VDWSELADRVASRLARMEKWQHLVLMSKPFPPYDGPAFDPNYYVQFACGGEEGLLAEAVSNRFLTGPARLTVQAEARLIEMGWHRPDTGTWGPLWDPCNYWRIWEPPVPTHEAASVALSTLQDTYRVERPFDLCYRAGHPDGRRFLWTDLGLDPEVEA
jgi:T3SS (YopN, CesT) and YbjN peptide-binding chaperone 3